MFSILHQTLDSFCVGWWEDIGYLGHFSLSWGGEQCGRSRWSFAQWLVAGQMQMQFRLFHYHRHAEIIDVFQRKPSKIWSQLSPGSLVSVARAGTSVLQWVAKKVLLDPSWSYLLDMEVIRSRKDEFHQPRCRNSRLNHSQPSKRHKRHRSNAHFPIETNRNQWASSAWHGLNPCPGTLHDGTHWVIHVNVLVHGQICQSLALVWSCLIKYDPREVRTWMDTMAMTLGTLCLGASCSWWKLTTQHN